MGAEFGDTAKALSDDGSVVAIESRSKVAVYSVSGDTVSLLQVLDGGRGVAISGNAFAIGTLLRDTCELLNMFPDCGLAEGFSITHSSNNSPSGLETEEDSFNVSLHCLISFMRKLSSTLTFHSPAVLH